MATIYAWTTRCIPAFSVCAIFTLLFCSFVLNPHGKSDTTNQYREATIPQLILSAYTVLTHILSIVFPIRVCWAVRDLMKRMREAAEEVPVKIGRTQSIGSDAEVLESPVPLFVIILPAYKEEVTTMEETLRVLASHPQASSTYHIYLAMEEKEENSAFKAAGLINTFESSFFRISYTVHPSGLPGEAQGKSSNEAWAAKQAMQDYADESVKQNTIVTVMDADTHLSPRYFNQIARLHIEHTDTNQATMYVPPLVFDRNLHHVPLPVRTADLMWAGAGISSLYSGSSICIPTSVYSLPMALVEQVGGWDTGPVAIGEDLHMYLKCFFALSGNLKVHVVYAAASQCNVSSDETGALGYVTGLQARYKQALRHMWGALDSGYAMRQTLAMLKRHKQASRLHLSEPRPAIYLDKEKLGGDTFVETTPIHWKNMATLGHRLFEAHFLPIHLAVILITSSVYTFFTPAYLVPTAFKLALDLASLCRLIGWCTMLCYFYLYDRYHRLCVGLRQEEMRTAGLLEYMTANDGFTPKCFQFAGLLEAACFPIGGFIFGAIPAIQAELSHLFTDRLTYVVSLKPQLPALKPWKDVSRMTP